MNIKDNPRDFATAIGSTVLDWQSVEVQLFRMFMAVTHAGKLPDKGRAIGAVFHTVTSFRTRLEMTDGAASVTLPSEMWEEWQAIAGRLQRKARLRNEVVHYTLVQESDGTFPDLEFYYELMPTPYDARRSGHKAGKDTRLRLGDVEDRRKGVMAVSSQLGSFVDRVLKAIGE